MLLVESVCHPDRMSNKLDALKRITSNWLKFSCFSHEESNIDFQFFFKKKFPSQDFFFGEDQVGM